MEGKQGKKPYHKTDQYVQPTVDHQRTQPVTLSHPVRQNQHRPRQQYQTNQYQNQSGLQHQFNHQGNQFHQNKQNHQFIRQKQWREVQRSSEPATLTQQNKLKEASKNDKKRNFMCLYDPGKQYLHVDKIDHKEVKLVLSKDCPSIEHQFIALRNITQLKQEDYQKRYAFTKLLLDCIKLHEDITFEGIIFGSSVNGLGFKDSDVDLKLRPVKKIDDNMMEPYIMDEDKVRKFLMKISYKTMSCAPLKGVFVPSTRCPVAKMKFFTGLGRKEEGLSYDISLSSSNFLGPFNSMFLRFLSIQQPKFHLLATVLRYWSARHNLIQPGKLSSYALINMLIFFCQTLNPPLLPTVDEMRDLYLRHLDKTEGNSSSTKRFYTQVEWQCKLSFDKKFFKPSSNKEPLTMILLKFFEFYLKFPYNTHIITIRPGRALTHQEFKDGNQFHPKFPIKEFLNIQDPFDLKHNLTSGIPKGHFKIFMSTIRYSYEKLYNEIMNTFERPDLAVEGWGLNKIFVPLCDKDFRKTPMNGESKQKKLIVSRDEIKVIE